MRLSKSKLFAVQVANFAAEHGMSGRDVVELVTLAERAFSAGVRDCNEGSDASDRASEKAGSAFNEAAREAGFDVEWPGLWPTLRKAGEWVHLPCESN
jgi:hypothetical protein